MISFNFSFCEKLRFFFYYCSFVGETRESIRLRKLQINVYVTLKILQKTIRLCIAIILAMFNKQI